MLVALCRSEKNASPMHAVFVIERENKDRSKQAERSCGLLFRWLVFEVIRYVQRSTKRHAPGPLA